jgi:hypothetical protein
VRFDLAAVKLTADAVNVGENGAIDGTLIDPATSTLVSQVCK